MSVYIATSSLCKLVKAYWFIPKLQDINNKLKKLKMSAKNATLFYMMMNMALYITFNISISNKVMMKVLSCSKIVKRNLLLRQITQQYLKNLSTLFCKCLC